MKNCVICGKEFSPRNRVYTTCSKICKKENQRRVRIQNSRKYYADPEKRVHHLQTVKAYKEKNAEKVKAGAKARYAKMAAYRKQIKEGGE